MEWCLHNIFSHLMISSSSKMKILHSNWLFLAIVILTAMVVLIAISEVNQCT